jgi:hypothetical protein
MPTLAERRKMAAAEGPMGNGEFITFKQEGEVKTIRFLFTDAEAIESHRKFYNEETKEWEIDGDRGSWKVLFNCVEYDEGGKNPRRVRWELSEYLYNEYLSPYVEKDNPASKNVWQIKVRRPKTMDVSYIAFRLEDATEETYPIPDMRTPQAQVSKPTYATVEKPKVVKEETAPAAQEIYVPPTQPTTVIQPVKKSKYF